MSLFPKKVEYPFKLQIINPSSQRILILFIYFFQILEHIALIFHASLYACFCLSVCSKGPESLVVCDPVISYMMPSQQVYVVYLF